MLTITAKELETIIMNTEAFSLEASSELQNAYQQRGTFLPALDNISHEKLLRIAIEVKDYTERCWRATNRLLDLQPTSAQLDILEFGL